MQKIDRTVCIAPMLDCTDRHFRYFARLMTQHTVLYSEMITANALVHGDRDYLLGFSNDEQPVALQLGGSDPAALVEAAKIGEQYGYIEINLNVGCPSDRVQAGRFGACLMKEPQLVAECVASMTAAVSIPVTVKTRLGVDDQDSYELLCRFVEKVKEGGCTTFIIHARKAWLKGLSPRENRLIPPLCYDRVYQLKKDFADLDIIINGGIKTYEQMHAHLQHVDGVMVGREAYANPYMLAEIDQRFYGVSASSISEKQLLTCYAPYVEQQIQRGVPLRTVVRYLVGLFKGQQGARQWRRYLSEHSGDGALGAGVITEALAVFETA